MRLSLFSYNNGLFGRQKSKLVQKRIAAFSLIFLAVQILSPFGSIIEKKTAHAAILVTSPYKNYQYNYKGNLHAHTNYGPTTPADGTIGGTNNDDGENNPDVVGDWYATNGFDFYALSGHYNATSRLSVVPNPGTAGIVWMGSSMEDNFRSIPGNTTDCAHVGLINLSSGLVAAAPDGKAGILGADPAGDSLLSSVNADGGFGIINHPNYNTNPVDTGTCQRGPVVDELMSMNNFTGMEIYNSATQSNERIATSEWDSMLNAGKGVWGFANDDAHTLADRGKAFIVVNSSTTSGSLTKADIITQIKAGNFYATTAADASFNPYTLSAVVTGDTISATTTNGSKIRWIQDGLTKKTTVSTTDTYTPEATASYVRFEILNSSDVAVAWSQPFAVSTYTDVTKPVVTTFTTGTVSDLTVPISSFTVTDNDSVAGYKITETSTAPTAESTGWSATVPASYTAASAGSRTLYPWAKDTAGNVSAVFGTPRSVTFTSSDITAPIVDTFTVGTVSGLTVPVTAFTATDNVAVTGYLITESSTTPAASAAGWTGTAPSSYTSSAAGTKSLYPWAKDADGNVSTVFDSPCTVIFTDILAPTLTPGIATRTDSNAARVKFTSNEPGSYYYAVVEKDATAPSVNTSGVGVAIDTSENTIIVTGLVEDSAKDIYIKVKDLSSNVSIALKIVIPVWPTVPVTQYNLTTSVLPQGSGNITGNSGSYQAGTQASITANAGSEYIFSSWSGNCEGATTSITITMNSDKACVANFTSKVNPAVYDFSDTNVAVSENGATVTFVGSLPSGSTGINMYVSTETTTSHDIPSATSLIKLYSIVAVDQNDNPITDFGTGSTAHIVLTYTGSKTSDILKYWDGMKWSTEGTSNTSIDTNANTISFDTTHFSEYAILASTSATPNVMNPSIAPSSASLPISGSSVLNLLLNMVLSGFILYLVILLRSRTKSFGFK